MKNRVNLLEGNITKSITRLALPIMGMSFLQMAYNITDIFWIGKLGAGAVASVGTGGLLMWFSNGIINLSKVGGQVYSGQNLGAKKPKEAASYAYASLILSSIICVILGSFFFFFDSEIVSFFNLNDSKVIIDAENYLKITGGLIYFSLVGRMITTLITTTGNSKAPLKATAVGLVINMLLDPILIFGWFGFPELGVIGAAIATVFAQFVSFVLLVFEAINDQAMFKYIKLTRIPEMKFFKKILKLSYPAAIQNTFAPVVSMYLSRMIAGFGDNAVAVQRIGAQIESLSWMTADGFAVALNTFVAQNFGAKNIKRAKEGFNKATKLMLVYGTLVTFILIFGAEPIFSIFITDPATVIIGTEYLIILGVSQLFQCIEILSAYTLYALNKTKITALITIIFTAIRIPLAIILSATILGLNGIWWSLTISTIFKGILSTLLVIYVFRKLLKKSQQA